MPPRLETIGPSRYVVLEAPGPMVNVQVTIR
jgi:hypothetical protein